MRIAIAFAGLLVASVALIHQIESAPSARAGDEVSVEVEVGAAPSARSDAAPSNHGAQSHRAVLEHGTFLRYKDCVVSALSEFAIEPCYGKGATINGRPAAHWVAFDRDELERHNHRYETYVADPRLLLADRTHAAAVVVETAEHTATSRLPAPAPSTGALGVLAMFDSDGRVTRETRANDGRLRFGRAQLGRTKLLDDLPGVVVASGSDREVSNLDSVLELFESLERKQPGEAMARVRSDVRYVDPLYERVGPVDTIRDLWADRFLRDPIVELEILTAFAASDWVFVDVAVVGPAKHAPKVRYFLFAELEGGLVIRWIGLPG